MMFVFFKIRGFLPYLSVVFLNAFVDLGHKITIQNTIFKTYHDQQQIILTAIVNALILLPFVMIMSPAGYCSDRYPKDQIIRISAWFAVFLSLAITLFYYLGWFWLAFAATFLLALQSAFYSPAKYGYLKEKVNKEKLVGANGLIHVTTIMAILGAIFFFSILFETQLAGKVYADKSSLLLHIAPIGWCLFGISLIELILAYQIPKTRIPNWPIHFNPASYIKGVYLKDNIQLILKQKTILLAIIGLSIFWSVSQVVIAVFPAHAKTTMLITDTRVIQGTLACAGIGILFGALVIGYISRRYIETSLIPIGFIGGSLTLLLMPWLPLPGYQAVNFLLWGVFASLLIVPLNALIQFHARYDQLGRVLAGSNFIQNFFMLAFLVMTVISSQQGMGSHTLFTILFFIFMISAICIIYKLPQSLVRFIIGGVLSYRYRLTVFDLQYLPEQGGVLILGNQLSWVDCALIQVACPRPIRLVMTRQRDENRYIKWFFNIFNVIPINAEISRFDLQAIHNSLNNGQVVCLCPDSITGYAGQLLRLQSFRKTVNDINAVILPLYLKGAWPLPSNQVFNLSQRAGIRRDVIVAFGKPLAIHSGLEQLKHEISGLSVDTWERYSRSLPDIASSFLAMAKKDGRALATIDVHRPQSFNRIRLLVATICLSRLIKQRPEQNIGVVLPTSSVGAMVNLAVWMGGKTVVNLNFTASQLALKSAVEKAAIRTIYTSKKFLDRLKQKKMDIQAVLVEQQFIYLEDLIEKMGPLSRLKVFITATLLPTRLLKEIYCRKIDTDGCAAILFSSGSEGEPKGVMLSHRNMMANLKQIAELVGIRDTDVVMANLPLFHSFGLTVTMLMPLLEGIPVVCHPDPRDVVGTAKAIEKYQASLFCGTSSLLRLYIENRRVSPLMLRSLRAVVAGAEKLNPDIRRRFELKFAKEVYEGYGVTETAPVASVNMEDMHDPASGKPYIRNKIGTVGMPVPGTCFRIVDPATMEVLAKDVAGLILIGGAQIMMGYLEDKAKTDEAIIEIDGRRWYKTGDQGYLDEDGFLTIIDRYSRFAKIGGEMISLAEVEGQARRALGKPDLELVAINLPDDRKGEQIALVLVGAYELKTIKKAMLDSGSRPLMLPSMVRKIDKIPTLGSGKTDFKTVKQWLQNGQI